jgi:hypothetical protein
VEEDLGAGYLMGGAEPAALWRATAFDEITYRRGGPDVARGRRGTVRVTLRRLRCVGPPGTWPAVCRPFIFRGARDWVCGVVVQESAGVGHVDEAGEALSEESVWAQAVGDVWHRVRWTAADRTTREAECVARGMEVEACRTGIWGPYLDWLEERGDNRRLHLAILVGLHPFGVQSGVAPEPPGEYKGDSRAQPSPGRKDTC